MKRKILLLIIITLFGVMFTSCGTTQLSVTSDYDREIYNDDAHRSYLYFRYGSQYGMYYYGNYYNYNDYYRRPSNYRYYYKRATKPNQKPKKRTVRGKRYKKPIVTPRKRPPRTPRNTSRTYTTPQKRTNPTKTTPQKRTTRKKR